MTQKNNSSGLAVTTTAYYCPQRFSIKSMRISSSVFFLVILPVALSVSANQRWILLQSQFLPSGLVPFFETNSQNLFFIEWRMSHGIVTQAVDAEA